MSEYDFVVIGGGSAGYAGASLAAKLGLKTALVEGGAEVGGLCILRGCMPSKTIIESANRFATLRRAEEFGLRAENLSVRPEEIMARKRKLVAEFADYRRGQLEKGAFDFVRGRACFVDPHTIEVVGEKIRTRIKSKTFLLATGSAVSRVAVPGLEETGYRDSDAVLEWHEIPESIAVLGAGATGLEFAHYFASLGTKVSVIQRGGQLLKDTDADVAGALDVAMTRRGVDIFYQTKITRTELCGEKKRIYFQHGGSEKFVEVSEIIYALGRQPQLTGLDLESAGVAVENERLKMGGTQQTSAPHIFAAGDCAGPYEIVHVAIQQAEVAARNAARVVHSKNEPLEHSDYRLKLFVVFTHPEVASVGATERELQAAGTAHRTASYCFADHGKAMVMGETDGLVKLIASPKSGEILGGAVVGPGASQLIHEIVVAMHFRATARDLAAVPHYHPTLSEIWTYPAEELAEM